MVPMTVEASNLSLFLAMVVDSGRVILDRWLHDPSSGPILLDPSPLRPMAPALFHPLLLGLLISWRLYIRCSKGFNKKKKAFVQSFCSICTGKDFEASGGFSAHVNMVHRNILKCERCGHPLSSKAMVAEHFLEVPREKIEEARKLGFH